MKKIVSGLMLFLCMFVLCIGISIQTESVDKVEHISNKNINTISTASNSDFTISGTKLTDYIGTDTVLTADDFPSGITTIGSNAFRDSAALYIELPSTITTIENFGFYYCDAEEIIIPSSVTSIGTGAFYRCSSLHVLYCEFTSVSVFASAQISYAPNDLVIYVPYDSVESFRSSSRLATYANRVSSYSATISFVTNNNTTIADGIIHFGEEYSSLLPNVTKSGYDFIGWADSNNTIISQTDVYNVWEPELTLTARYSIKCYELKIVNSSQTYWITSTGAMSTTAISIEYGTTVNWTVIAANYALQLQDPSKKVTEFKIGTERVMWTAIPDLGANETVVTLTPVLETKIFTIEYYTYLDGVWHSISGYEYGDSITLPIITSANRDGYTYDGWVVAGTTAAFTDTTVGAWNGYSNMDCTKSIRVKWIANQYTATLEYNDGTSIETT